MVQSIIESIEEIPHTEVTYNLHVEDNHNYYASGLNVSNCHLFKAKSLTTIMNNLTKAWLRIGTTGTLDGSLVSENVLEGCFGSVYNVISTKQLIDDDTLSNLSIDVIRIKYPDDERKAFGKKSYQEEIAHIVGHSKRNNFIRNLAITQKGNTLVLFNYVSTHGKPLFEMIKAGGGDRPIFYVSGETPTKDREKIRKLTENETNAIIVASSQTFATGINIKELHNLIFAAPTKSQIRVLQSIGRTLRKSATGQPAKIYDIVDDFGWKSRKNYTLKHGAHRVQIYIKERLSFKTYQVDF